MQMMEGDLTVGHSGSQGTEFRLELKMADAETSVVEIESGADRPAPLGSFEVTILQVEDNPTNVRLLERIMSRRPNVNLITVQKGGEAVDAARNSQAALILLDVNLPDISGREVLARLRAEPTTSHIPVVMLSADASGSQIEKLLAAGASAYVTKPLDIGHFLSVVDDVLERGAAA
jgi:CheY-like chemotaxis protein